MSVLRLCVVRLSLCDRSLFASVTGVAVDTVLVMPYLRVQAFAWLVRTCGVRRDSGC